LVTAHKRPLPFADHLATRAHNSPELVAMDASFMLYLVLDETLAYYEVLNRHLQAEVELLEERALRDPTEAFLEHLLRFKRYAYALAQLAEQHRDVFAAFLRPDFPWVAGTEAEEYFRDLEARLAREAVVGAFDIDVSHMAHRTNQVIKMLTMVSTIILPATLIISLFGTSIGASVHDLPVQTPVGLALMLLCIALVSGGILWLFHRRDWLWRRRHRSALAPVAATVPCRCDRHLSRDPLAAAVFDASVRCDSIPGVPVVVTAIRGRRGTHGWINRPSRGY
jgi:magnesium transporter